MGVERDFKIVRTVERLNRIINQSRMTTRFVSLFYGEIEELEGNFMYVNAGHPPPIHFHSGGVTMLRQTGMVLGPSATSTYSRGFRLLERGDAILMYTDGMFEAHGADGSEFGLDRLIEAFSAIREKPADEIARRLIENVREWSGGEACEDDQTVVVLKRGDDPPRRTSEGVIKAADGTRLTDPGR
jgi:sigma-B regulation protein RsbU (phosphoserine phosphatase)